MLACLTLGGGTRPGFLGDVLLQLLSIPLLLVALHLMMTGKATSRREARGALFILLLLILLFFIQLIPLPAHVWPTLAGRQIVVRALEAAGTSLPALPLSVTPDQTLLAFLSIVPSVAVFLLTLTLNYRERIGLIGIVAAFSLISAFLGLLQIAQGEASSLRPFEFTNTTEAVGLFANRNHFAALMYSALLFVIAGALAVFDDTFASGLKATARRNARIVALIGSFAALLLLVAAQLMARSRAGLALALLGMFTVPFIPLYLRRGGGRGAGGGSRMVLAAVVLTVLYVGNYALSRIAERAFIDPTAGSRLPYARNTIEAALDFSPWGAGIGSFRTVYAAFEKIDDLTWAYVNRAHNDYLEFWLEGGVFAIVIVTLFMIWLASRLGAIWSGVLDKASRHDLILARAASIAVTLIVLHSLIDYPLRTGAIGALFAFCCALMIPPALPAATQAHCDAFDVGLPVGEKRRRSASDTGMPTPMPQLEPTILQPPAAPPTRRPPPLPPIAWPDPQQVRPAAASSGTHLPAYQQPAAPSTATATIDPAQEAKPFWADEKKLPADWLPANATKRRDP